MGIITAFSALAGFGIVLALVRAIRHFAEMRSFPVTTEWIDQLSIERYKPMLRLLDGDDL